MTVEAEAVVPEVITREVVLGWKASEMLAKIRNPEIRAQVELVMNAPEPDPEAEAAAQAEQQRIADEAAEAKRIADEATAAEVTRQANEVAAAEEAAKVPVYKKLVVEYQATDASGNKIGRPTHLEEQYIDGDKDSLIAAYQAMSEKQRIAHVNATQALENIKKRQVTFAKEEKPAPVGLSEEEIKQIASELDDDPEKAKTKVAAIRKLSNADAAEQREREAEFAKAAAEAQKESYKFMSAHLTDFYPCQANSDALTEYINGGNPTGEKLAWTQDNLEIAFAAVESNLAPPPSRPVEPVPQPQPAVVPAVAPVIPVAPVAEVPVTPVEPPVVAAPAVAPAVEPANPATPARRVPNGGIQPGTMTGRPPVAPAAIGMTKRDVLKMPRDEYKQKIKDPKFRALVNKIFAEQTTS